jgi:Baseplate J-like protein
VFAGATVETSDGSQKFTITADPTFATYSPALNGYTLAASVASINVPVVDTVAGSAGNVTAGSISVITSAVFGIDSVINGADFTNGADQESDNALKSRFSAYILGLSRGDVYGLTSSILGSGVTVQFALTESYNLDGSRHDGYFFVIADDGSGSPPGAFLQIVDIS